MSALTQSQAWKALHAHFISIKDQSMMDWFSQDKERFSNFSLEAAGIFLDYSKNRLNQETLSLLVALAEQTHLQAKQSNLFAGQIVNQSERRAAQHMSLRYQGDEARYVQEMNVMPEIQQCLNRMAEIVYSIHHGEYLGMHGQPIDTIVNIGIGGSDFGPQLVLNALSAYTNPKLQYYFLNIHDQWFVNHVLKELNPATTLFIATSKSFTTEETLANVQMVKEWQLMATGDPIHLQRHWIAVTAAPERALALGIAPENILAFWEWVGGRYSVWSAVSLIVAIAIGMPQFKQFLAGGHAMDEHFLRADLAVNMPVILALLDVWYQNFFKTASRVILPYGQRLRLLPEYLQQLHMESLGKQINQKGESIDYKTGSILWGGVGTNTQHSFHQLLMQGTQLVPADFIFALDKKNPFDTIDRHLLSHCLAQSRLLMKGYHQNSGDISPPASQQIIPGNVPSNTLLLADLSPYHLGALIALYEHKVFSYAAILDINPFDQWGVERGKQIAKQINATLCQRQNSDEISCYDSSTQGLLSWAQKQ